MLVAWQSVTIGRGVWQLCEGRNFTGRCVTLDRSTPDLQTYRLGNRVGSAQPVGAGTPGPAPGSDWYVVVFDQPNYRGNPINYTGEVPNLNGRIRSITIGKGQWELCEGRDFTGRCFRLERSSADLRAHVGSLRPLVRQPR